MTENDTPRTMNCLTHRDEADRLLGVAVQRLLTLAGVLLLLGVDPLQGVQPLLDRPAVFGVAALLWLRSMPPALRSGWHYWLAVRSDFRRLRRSRRAPLGDVDRDVSDPPRVRPVTEEPDDDFYVSVSHKRSDEGTGGDADDH